MAKINLQFKRDINEIYDLPPVCMSCGTNAALIVKRRFGWFPPWVLILIPFGVLPYIIVGEILKKRAKVEVPLCARHKNHFKTRQWVGLAGLVALMILVGLTCVAGAVIAPQKEGLGGIICLSFIPLAVLYAIGFAIVDSRITIHPTRIDDDGIELTNVSDDFVTAFEEAESRLQAERPERRGDRRRPPRSTGFKDDDPRD
jgi:hypothetical protein